MNKPPRLFRLYALCLVLAMTWANWRGYMVSSLFTAGEGATRAPGSHMSHK